MEFIEVSAKTVDEALTEASISLGIPSSEIEYAIPNFQQTLSLGGLAARCGRGCRCCAKRDLC